MHRAYKIRLHPTPEQAAYVRRATGTQRFVFNWGPARITEALDAGEKPPHVLELKKTFNALKGEQFPWFYEVTRCAVDGGFHNLQAALGNFFQSQKGERKGKKIGFPQRKSRQRGYVSLTLANDKVSHAGHTVTIPRLGKVNMTEAVRFDGKLLRATVSYRAGWWWISFACDVAHEAPPHHGHALGIDVGVKHLAVDFDGQRYENQAPLLRLLQSVA
jgi:putative transposase